MSGDHANFRNFPISSAQRFRFLVWLMLTCPGLIAGVDDRLPYHNRRGTFTSEQLLFLSSPFGNFGREIRVEVFHVGRVVPLPQPTVKILLVKERQLDSVQFDPQPGGGGNNHAPVRPF
jgi:hypothetical protein